MKHLYAPWRGEYTRSTEQKKNTLSICPFCIQGQEKHDSERFIIKRYKHTFVMLNTYPYNLGHCMVIPYQHTGSLAHLSSETRSELIEVVTTTNSILERMLKTDGINIGLNSGGKAAGGSIPEHLHMHVVPRWLGDTNFLVTLADTKPLSGNLGELYLQLKEAF